MATAGVAPRVMGIGPAPAVQKLLRQTGMTLDQMDLIELNEAFAAQGLAVLRQLGLSDDRSAREPERRRDRARPSARHERRAPGDHGHVPAASHRRPLRPVHHVHRRRAGNCDDHRKSVVCRKVVETTMIKIKIKQNRRQPC
jgi:hypothetical protein